MKIYIFKACLLAGAVSLGLTSCIDDVEPTNGVTGDQVEVADKVGLSRAVTAYMTRVSSYSDGADPSDIGFPQYMIWRESMTADFAPASSTYDYYNWFYQQSWLGDYAIQTDIWRRHYGLAFAANLLLKASSMDNPNDLPYIGNALTHRAMAYMDLSRYYEYKPTGVAALDAKAEASGIYGLTVPIVLENITEEEGRNNPRAPFYTMYRFIMNDLDMAEKALDNYRTTFTKNEACQATVYGLKARLWLEIASRFDQKPADLEIMLSHDGDPEIAYPALGIKSAREAFQNAQKYAEKVISLGYSPLGKEQWYDVRNGFNTPTNSWVWAVIIGQDDDCAFLDWQSWVSYVSPEANWGIGNPTYNAMRMIDARLFNAISKDDWRRDTWVDPAEVADKEAYETKYSKVTQLPFADFSKCAAYVGFKFHPANGEMNNAQVGNAVSIPLMRVEEMWFIKAEAQAAVDGVEAGRQTLETFMNQYRWRGTSPYVCRSASRADFVRELIDQKRVEFWGEGITAWDFKRLNRAVERNYPGTNHYVDGSVVNSYEGYCAPWMNLYLPDSERNNNGAVILNPDPTSAIK